MDHVRRLQEEEQERKEAQPYTVYVAASKNSLNIDRQPDVVSGLCVRAFGYVDSVSVPPRYGEWIKSGIACFVPPDPPFLKSWFGLFLVRSADARASAYV